MSQRLSQKFRDIFTSDHLEKKAKESGFIQRRSRLTAKMFFDTLLFKEMDNSLVSLNDHSIDLKIKYDVQICKQSLAERFNERSVCFVKALVEEQLKNQICSRIDIKPLKRFSSVKIKDSTRFQLPVEYKEAFPANGGDASESGLHIQFEFDLTNGKISDLTVTDALKQDNSNARITACQVEPGSLLLRDLGYFSLDAFQQFDQRSAYFISRLMPRIKLYQLRNGIHEVIQLEKLHQKMKRFNIPYQEMEVYLGDQYKIPVRLFIEQLPEQQVHQRLKQAKRTCVRKSRTLSRQYKVAAALNLFVTNVPKQWLPIEYIRDLYRLRWQIELRFKVWKSLGKLHLTKTINRFRFETYLYANLLLLLINWEIAANISSFLWLTKRKILSVFKYYKTAFRNTALLREVLVDSKKLLWYLNAIYEMCHRNLIAEKRVGKLSQEEIFLLSFKNSR